MKQTNSRLVCAFGVLFAVNAAQAAVIINDPTMAGTDYSAPGYNAAISFGPAGTMVAASLGSGGNTGPYRQLTYTGPATPSANGSYFSQFNLVTNWNPASTAISTVSFGLDTFSPDVDGSNLFAVLYAVRQNSNVYTNFAYFTVPNTTWSRYNSVALTQTSFNLTGFPGNNPDFSSTGGLVEFGFEISSTLINRPSAKLAYGTDNFCVAVNGGSCAASSSTPEPASWALVLLPLGLLAVRRFQKNSHCREALSEALS